MLTLPPCCRGSSGRVGLDRSGAGVAGAADLRAPGEAGLSNLQEKQTPEDSRWLVRPCSALRIHEAVQTRLRQKRPAALRGVRWKKYLKLNWRLNLVTLYDDSCVSCDRFLVVKRGWAGTGERVQTPQVPTASASRHQPQHVRERSLFGDAYRPRQELVLPATGCLF